MYEQRLSFATPRIRIRAKEQPALAARLLRQRESMRSFERVSVRVSIIGSAGVAIAMTVLICTATHLLG